MNFFKLKTCLNHIDTGCVINPSQSKWLPKSEMQMLSASGENLPYIYRTYDLFRAIKPLVARHTLQEDINKVDWTCRHMLLLPIGKPDRKIG